MPGDDDDRQSNAEFAKPRLYLEPVHVGHPQVQQYAAGQTRSGLEDRSRGSVGEWGVSSGAEQPLQRTTKRFVVVDDMNDRFVRHRLSPLSSPNSDGMAMENANSRSSTLCEPLARAGYAPPGAVELFRPKQAPRPAGDAPKDTEVARLRAGARGVSVAHAEAAAQDLSNGCRAARHTISKAEIVERRKLPTRQHKLKAFASLPALLHDDNTPTVPNAT